MFPTVAKLTNTYVKITSNICNEPKLSITEKNFPALFNTSIIGKYFSSSASRNALFFCISSEKYSSAGTNLSSFKKKYLLLFL